MARSQVMSESAAWHAMLGFLDQIDSCGTSRQRGVEIDRARHLALTMASQVASGTHANPPSRFLENPGLLVWPNPPKLAAMGKRFGVQVYDIRYRHAGDNRDYVHPFSTRVELWKVAVGSSDGVLIVGADGQAITGEF